MKLILIEWEDAAHIGQSATWETIDEARVLGKDPVNCKTVGFVVEETDSYILLARGIGGASGNEVEGLFKLPTGWITKKKNLR